MRPASGLEWLTVPLLMKGHVDKSIGEMKINPAVYWKRKHTGTLAQPYRGRPYYGNALAISRRLSMARETRWEIFYLK